MSDLTRSPWWYRSRGPVFGFIFALGFVSGGIPAELLRQAYVPTIVMVARFFGEGGGLVVAGIVMLFLFAAYAVRLWGSSYLHTATVWSVDARDDTLVIAGPFRYTRNPLYLGNIFLAIGIGAFAPPVGSILIVAGHLLFIEALIAWEERGLHRRYGAAFDAYCRAVPRFFPRLFPVAPSGCAHPTLREGLLCEVFTASLVFGMLPLFVIGYKGWFVFFGCFVIGKIAQSRVAKRAASRADALR